MKLQQVGQAALRAPDGTFLPAVPIYREVVTAAQTSAELEEATDYIAELAVKLFSKHAKEALKRT